MALTRLGVVAPKATSSTLGLPRPGTVGRVGQDAALAQTPSQDEKVCTLGEIEDFRLLFSAPAQTHPRAVDAGIVHPTERSAQKAGATPCGRASRCARGARRPLPDALRKGKEGVNVHGDVGDPGQRGGKFRGHDRVFLEPLFRAGAVPGGLDFQQFLRQ